jgi:hypothetical protein
MVMDETPGQGIQCPVLKAFEDYALECERFNRGYFTKLKGNEPNALCAPDS